MSISSRSGSGSHAGPSGAGPNHGKGTRLLDTTTLGPESFEMEESSTTLIELKKRRFGGRNCFGIWLDTDGLNDDGAYKVSGTFAVLSVAILISVGVLTVRYLDAQLPTPLQIKDIPKNPTSFIEERARSDLYHLTSVGVRVSGDPVTDNVTVGMFLDILADIRSDAVQNGMSLEYEVQRPTGAFYRGENDGHISCYSKIANVIAKLEPSNIAFPANHSILVNCHFDTKPGSPGATDNMISCVTMLEVIRVLSTEKNSTLKNSMIFLFNGAEELGLQGAHGFVKGYEGALGNPDRNQEGHRWMKNLRTFINLEGAGGGGRELLFQTGPGNSWTLKAYASVAPYPYGVVIAEEAFQMRLIPSDTDFRIFRDFGDLAGLDMAFIKNGWVYHTKWDKLSEIPPGSIQHMGANTLAILRHFSGKVDFSKIDFDSSGKMIYFDVLGLFMVYYPRWAGILIDCVIGLLRLKAESKRSFALALIWMPVSAILSWALGIVTAILVALFLNGCGYYKPFYTYPTLATIIFGVPAAISQILLHSYAQNRSPMQTWMAQKLALAVILVIMTFITRAVFIISINLLFSVTFWLLMRFLCRGWPRAITLTHLIAGEFIPFLMSFYLLTTLSDVFVPIIGRSGSEMNANLFYGLIVSAIISVLIWNGFCFVFVPFRRRVLWLCLAAMFFVGNGLLVFGFIGKIPYQEKTPMRLNIVDVDRTFYNVDGVTVNKTEAGYWFWPYDSNTRDFLPRLAQTVPELSSAVETRLDYDNCEHLYCAQPFLWPMDSIKSTHWLPRAGNLSDSIKDPVKLSYTISGSESSSEKTVHFSVEGPTQFTLVFSPGPSYKLVNWSLADFPANDKLRWQDRSAYFIYHSRGFGIDTIHISCTFQRVGGSDTANETLVTAQYTGYYLYGNELMTPEFSDMVNRLPGWSYTMPWTAVMKNYEIVADSKLIT